MLSEKVERLLDSLAAFGIVGSPSGSNPSVSNAANAQEIFESLEKCIEYEDGVGDPIISVQDFAAFKIKYDHFVLNHDGKIEEIIVHLVSPYLKLCFSDDYILLNSEKHKWLKTNEYPFNDKAPELFSIPKFMFEKRTKTSNALFSKKCGICSSVDFYSSIFILDGKIELNPFEFYKVVSMMKNLVRFSKVGTRGLIFNLSDAWLIEMNGIGDVLSVIKLKFTQPGSFNLVKNFFSVRSEYFNCLESVCSIFDVNKPVEFISKGSTCNVFRLENNQVLKFCFKSDLNDNLRWLQDEVLFFERVKSCAKIHNYFMLPIQYYMRKNYGALLLPEVGDSFNNMIKGMDTAAIRFFLYQIIEVLARIHLLGIEHGDSRIHNVLFVKSSSSWKFIDARPTEAVFNSKRDWIKFKHSLKENWHNNGVFKDQFNKYFTGVKHRDIEEQLEIVKEVFLF